MREPSPSELKTALIVAEPHELAPASDDWMLRLLQLPLIARLSPLQLPKLYACLQTMEVAADQLIVRQNEPGDAFYLIVRGRCQVTREHQATPMALAELGPGDSFGEEALISGAPRNATVTMRSEGLLLRLDREDFRALRRGQRDATISASQAHELLESGRARCLDVRLAADFADNGDPQALNIPLHLLRLKLAQLDRRLIWICCGDDSQRNAIAAFVLTQRGFDARVLEAAGA